MSGQHSPSYFSSQEYPAMYRLVLIALAIISLASGLTVNILATGLHLPHYIYAPVTLACLGLAIGSLYNTRISTNLFEYASYCYLFIYLGIIFLTYRNNFDIHFVIVLVAAHVLYALSFRNIVEFSIFAISSLSLLVLCTFMLDNIPFNKYVFNSILSIYTLFAGLHTWYKENKYESDKRHGRFLKSLLDSEDSGIFLINSDATFIYYRNPAAISLSKSLFQTPEITISELWDLLQLDKQFIVNKLKNAEPGTKEHGLYHMTNDAGNTITLEMIFQKLRTYQGTALLLQLTDITQTKLEEERLVYLETLDTFFFKRHLRYSIIVDIKENVKQIYVPNSNSNLPKSFIDKPLIHSAPEFFPHSAINQIRGCIHKLKESSQSQSTIIEHVGGNKISGYTQVHILSPPAIRPDIILLFEDISQKVFLEKSLTNVAQDYQSLFQANNQGIIIADVESKSITDMNMAAYHFTKFTPEEVASLHITDLFIDEKNELEKNIQELPLNESITSMVKLQTKHPEDQRIQITIYKSILQERERLISMFSLMSASFDEKQDQEHSSYHITFREMFTHAPHAMIIQSLQGEIFEINQVALGLFQRPKTALIGKEFAEYVLPSQKTKLLQRLPSVLQGSIPYIETVILLENGTEIPVELKAAPFNWNNKMATILHISPISARKEAQLALAQSEERYRTLIEKMNEGLIMTDLSGIIIFVNDKMASLMNKPRSEIIGQKFHQILWPIDASKNNVSFKDVESSHQYEIEFQSLNENSIWVLITQSPHKNSKGDTIGTIAIITDITDRKITELKLKEKNQELDSFVYKASHDLKGPLASIIGVTNIAQSEVKDEKANKYFQLISQSTQRLDSILVDLIDVTRLSKAQTTYQSIDIEQLINEIIESLQHLPNSKEIEFKVEVSLKDAFVSDPKLLISILQNLITNSITYFDSTKKQSFISIKAYQRNDCVEFIISDNGVGISEKILGKVFNMFYRGNTKSRGSGLGLYIVKNAVEKLNGICKLSSEEGVGTTFSFSVPSQMVNEESLTLTTEKTK